MSSVSPSIKENVEAIASMDPSGEEVYRFTWDLLRAFGGDEIEALLLERIQRRVQPTSAYLSALMHLGSHRSCFQRITIDYLVRLIHEAGDAGIVDNAVRALFRSELWNLASDMYPRLGDIAVEIMRGPGWSRSSISLATGGFRFVARRMRAQRALDTGDVAVPRELAERLSRRAAHDANWGFWLLGYEGRTDIIQNLIAFSAEHWEGDRARPTVPDPETQLLVTGMNGLNGRIRVRWAISQDARRVATAASAELLSHW